MSDLCCSTVSTQSVVPGAILVASLLGSIHCVGMCGPLVVAVCPTAKHAWGYHLGRLGGYLALGAVAGLLGQWVAKGPNIYISLGVSLAMGAALMALGICQWLGKGPHLKVPFLGRLPELLIGKKSARETSILFSTLFGAASIGLPCGWLYSMVLVSMSAQSLAGSMLLMGAFWLGTVPALMVGPVLLQLLVKRFSINVSRWVGVLFVLGGAFQIFIIIRRLVSLILIN